MMVDNDLVRRYINDLDERYPRCGMLTMNQLMEYTQLSRPSCTEIMVHYGKNFGQWRIAKLVFANWLATERSRYY